MLAQNVSDVDVIVTVDNAHLSRMPLIASQLEVQGFKVMHILDSIGAIAGRAPPDACVRLRSIDGVSAVEISEEVQIVPPGFEIP